MTRILFYLTVACFTMAPTARAQTVAKTVTTQTTIRVNSADLNEPAGNSPDWTDEENPPLSCRAAVKAAEAYCAAHTALHDPQPETIMLNRLSPTSNKWVYLVSLWTKERQVVSYLVYMNGKVALLPQPNR